MARLFQLYMLCALCLPAQNDTQIVMAVQDLVEAGNLSEAARLLREDLAKHPHDAGLLNLRGVVHAQRDELPAARADFAEAVRLNPQLVPAWQNLARACVNLNQPTCALEAWQRVLRYKPNDPEALTSLVAIYAEQGKFSDAQAAARRLAKQPAFSEADLNALQSSQLDSPKGAAVVAALIEGLNARRAAGGVSLQRLAIAYEQLHRPADARKTLERVALLDPTNTAHLLELARLAEDSKDHAGALGYLAHARDLSPDNARIHFLFGLIAGEMELPIEARQSLEKALALDPTNADYNYAMGSVILETRDAASAAAYFRQYVTADPTAARGHFALGVALFASGDYDNAKREMSIARESPQAAAPADYYLGRIARLEGDLDDATKRLQEAIGLRPNFAEPHTELARIGLLRGNLPAAHNELDLALKFSPENFQANEQLLVLYKRLQDPRAAAQAERLKKLDEERSRRADLMLRTLEMRP
jgi:tetratricopeptide (TPR) repeat protein